jgi:hypothetical protein
MPAILLARGPAVPVRRDAGRASAIQTAGLVGWMGQFAAEGDTLQPTSLAACLDRACGLPGSHAGPTHAIPDPISRDC